MKNALEERILIPVQNMDPYLPYGWIDRALLVRCWGCGVEIFRKNFELSLGRLSGRTLK